MSTFSDIMSDAFARLGVYAPGETISSADSAQALATFNDMLDNWSNQNLACYANVEQSFTLTVNISQYTIGPTGLINQTRPLQVLTNPGAARVIDANGTVYPVDVIDQFAWNSISSGTQPNSLVVTSNVPSILFYDPQYPNGILNVWPTPTLAYTLYFVSRLALVDAANLTSTITLPPGYTLALKTNLAAELLPYFPQDQVLTAMIMKRAKEALATVKRMNTKTPLAVMDKSLVKKGASGTYNIFTDGR